MADPSSPRTTYLLVDGENIDATLGNSILGHRPQSEQRPRWNTLLERAEELWDQPVKGLFFLAVNTELPASFVQALLAIGYRPIPLSGPGKVVDLGIQRTAEALAQRDADVILVSHDGDFVPQAQALADGKRRVGLIGFAEFMNVGLRQIPGVEFLDLEYDVGAFTARLPRVRVIPIEEFNPVDFL